MCGQEYCGVINLNCKACPCRVCIMSEFQRVAGPASRPKEDGDRLHVLVQVGPLMHALSCHCPLAHCSTSPPNDAGSIPFYCLLGRQAALSGLQLLPCWGTPGWFLNPLLISHAPCAMHTVCSRFGRHASGTFDLQALGDIEVIEARACLRCPWHYSKISLETGEQQAQEGSRHPTFRLAALRHPPRLCR